MKPEHVDREENVPVLEMIQPVTENMEIATWVC